jgi:hypothetical protein
MRNRDDHCRVERSRTEYHIYRSHLEVNQFTSMDIESTALHTDFLRALGHFGECVYVLCTWLSKMQVLLILAPENRESVVGLGTNFCLVALRLPIGQT